MVTVLVVVLPFQSATAPFWAGEFGPAIAEQHWLAVDRPLEPRVMHDKVESGDSVVVVTVSSSCVVVDVEAPKSVVLIMLVVTVVVVVVVEV